jgi:hypothetical protein
MEKSAKLNLEEFIAFARSEFAFLAAYGFHEIPLANHKHVNLFQVRFSNEKLILVVEGINWGDAAMTYFETLEGIHLPYGLFVPREDRSGGKKKRVEWDQRADIRNAAFYISQFCTDVLSGNMTRFEERLAHWRHCIGRDKTPVGPRKLP